MAADGASMAGLWLAVAGSGIYHGLSPGMGWPLAVSAALMEKRPRALVSALGLLMVGHAAAMLAVLLPLSLMTSLAAWRTTLQSAAGFALVVFGALKLIDRRHPRILTRIPPARLALWSFAVAMAHGAGLMLVPVYLGLCAAHSAGGDAHVAAGMLLNSGIAAGLVALVHALAMAAAGGTMAWLTWRWLGVGAISRSWLNLEAAWAVSLILVGAATLALNLG